MHQVKPPPIPTITHTFPTSLLVTTPPSVYSLVDPEENKPESSETHSHRVYKYEKQTWTISTRSDQRKIYRQRWWGINKNRNCRSQKNTSRYIISLRGLKNSCALAPYAAQHAVLVGSHVGHDDACMVGFAVGAAGTAPIIAKKLVTSNGAIVVSADAEDTFGVRDTTSHAAGGDWWCHWGAGLGKLEAMGVMWSAIDVVENVGLSVVQRPEQAFPFRRLLLDGCMSIRIGGAVCGFRSRNLGYVGLALGLDRIVEKSFHDSTSSQAVAKQPALKVHLLVVLGKLAVLSEFEALEKNPLSLSNSMIWMMCLEDPATESTDEEARGPSEAHTAGRWIRARMKWGTAADSSGRRSSDNAESFCSERSALDTLVYSPGQGALNPWTSSSLSCLGRPRVTAEKLVCISLGCRRDNFLHQHTSQRPNLEERVTASAFCAKTRHCNLPAIVSRMIEGRQCRVTEKKMSAVTSHGHGITYTTGQSSNSKDKVELSMAPIIHNVLRSGHSGAHSWKKMPINWSDSSLAGAFQTMGSERGSRGAISCTRLEKARPFRSSFRRKAECSFDSMSIFSSFSSSATAQLVAGLALESNAGTLRTTRSNSVASNLLASTSARSISTRGRGRVRPTYLSQACAIRDWELDPTLMTFMGKMPGMLPVFESGRVCGPVVCEHEISGVRVGDTEGMVHARGIGVQNQVWRSRRDEETRDKSNQTRDSKRSPIWAPKRRQKPRTCAMTDNPAMTDALCSCGGELDTLDDHKV
ncbi:hypothetical protein KCV06_g140, partial [Aureobasidium melanogenum]